MSNLQASIAFDPRELLSLIDGDPGYKETILSLLRSIIDNGTLPVDQSRQAWREGRADEAARRLHQARGSLGSFGIKRFSMIALELELALVEGPAERVPVLFEQARQELQAAADAVQAWIDGQSPARQDA